jgi:hypothetical protein
MHNFEDDMLISKQHVQHFVVQKSYIRLHEFALIRKVPEKNL